MYATTLNFVNALLNLIFDAFKAVIKTTVIATLVAVVTVSAVIMIIVALLT